MSLEIVCSNIVKQNIACGIQTNYPTLIIAADRLHFKPVVWDWEVTGKRTYVRAFISG